MIWTVTWHPAVTREHPQRLDLLKIVVPGALAYLFADETSGELLVGYVFERR
ncbi:MAG: hypothetical protein R3B70_20015 [Polyangiaceae bacterium]